MSILIRIPASMNCGTITCSPVSSVAGLYDAEAVAPFIPGWVSMTFRVTVLGSSMPTGFSS